MSKKLATIWTQPYCPYCKKAKVYLTSRGYSYIEKVIGDKYTRKDLLSEVPEAKTVPQIFINDEYVGGYEELLRAI